MTTRTVIYCSTSKLSCTTLLPSDVVLCIDPALIAPHMCTSYEYEQTYAYRHIEASLIAFCRTSTCERGRVYKYTFEYDDAQLELDTELTSEDIEGIFCKGCLSTYIEDLVGEEIQVEDDYGEITIRSQHGCEFSFNTGDANLTITDTDSVNLTYVAPNLMADVNISLEDDNQISILPDGLFSPPGYIPPSDNSTDLGTALLRWRDLYLANDAVINGNLNLASSSAIIESQDDIQFEIGGINSLDITDLGIKTKLTNFSVYSDTVNGADNKGFSISAGGADSSSRGAVIEGYGNEHARTGQIRLNAGDVTGAAITMYYGASVLAWAMDGAAGALVGYQTDNIIRTDTTDGADNKGFIIAAGGAGAASRGAVVQGYGNEYAGVGGNAYIDSGNVSGADINLRVFSTDGFLNFGVDAGVTKFQITPGGFFSQVGTNSQFQWRAGNESTGAGSALLAANCPAIDPTTPNTWLTVKKSDGTTLFVPAWA